MICKFEEFREIDVGNTAIMVTIYVDPIYCCQYSFTIATVAAAAVTTKY